ncbi:MAG: NfeD family protein [Bacteroidota bacterium]
MRLNLNITYPRLLAILLLSISTFHLGQAQSDKREKKEKVFIMEIKAEIDPRMARYVKLALEEARQQKADYVVVDMNTYGGRVDNADEIATSILNFEKPVFVFINNNAASAGAWISIACDSIYMSEGATIGAATVVTGDGTAAPDKYQSYMRGKMRATAAAQGRDPRIAEAMVDQTLEVEGVSPAGQVITFSTEEAIKNGYCEAEVESIEELLKRNNIDNYESSYFELSSIEKLISFFLNPYLSGILMLVILGGIYFELQTPGVGFPILAAAVAAVLYFIPYYMTGLAANWELVVFIVGILLLMAEVFVIPGFGVAGISGIVLTMGSLLLMMLGNDGFDFRFVLPADFFGSVTALAIGAIGGTIFIFLAMPHLVQSRRFKRISLQSSMNKDEGYTSTSYTTDLVGSIGLAYTVLRPSGKIKIEEELYDAYTQGDYIDKNTKVVVISQEGTSLKVKKSEE